ncbi:hypothetical protein [Microbacterium testaceum]|uniref:hypothetical protein n=1 Tax=Microbacterium testaceum TaxID=2033 RepID=UPI00124765CB|nr:hypothetical protein [Microbacterium testaceum]
MSNPRYVPRQFLAVPRDFGRRLEPEWVTPDATYDQRRLAQLDASKLQHQIAYGVTELYLKPPRSTKISDLAKALNVEYNRLQKVLSGAVVMQFEDFSRLRQIIGHQMDYWILRGPAAKYVRAVEADMRRRQDRAQ